MVTATNNSQAAGSTSSFSIPAPSTTAGSATDPFAQQLAQMIEGYLSKNGNSTSTSQLNVSITQSQGELSVTVQQGPNAAPSDSLMDSTNVTNAAAATSSTTPSGTTGATSSTTNAAPTLSAAQLAQMTPDQAYWAEQPPAVQALQNMDPADRGAAALQLAQQGYTIDVPIMVWGWDPLTTMVERQNYGYTWVPSAMQPMVPLAPGLSFPGLQSYDPTKPPQGSIAVTTDFAKGTNMQDVFIDPATIQASWSSPTSTPQPSTSQPTISA
jgi:hypothetical protein